MDKSQIQAHIQRIEAEEQGIPAPPAPTLALVPVSQVQTPPIVNSTIIIQEPPIPEDEADPITSIPVQQKPRVSLLLVSLSLILLLSIGLYVLIPLLFPSATVTIVPMEMKLSTTATIHIATQNNQLAANQIPGRLLPTLTLSQAETVKTTGVGHQPATEAQGYITLYNGLLVSQVISEGTVFTGSDGIQVITDQTAVIPVATPPDEGQVTIPAHAVESGSKGNIGAYDINAAVSASILAKNAQPFYGGRDARTYPMVAQSDIDTAVSHLKPTLNQSVQGAFTTQLVSGEALIQPTCVLKTVTDHNIGEEASQVQVSVSETCQTAAYAQADLQQTIGHLVSQEAIQRYGTGYSLAGDISVNLQNTTLTTTGKQIATIGVKAASRWIYQFGKRQQQQISNQIVGKGRGEAIRMLSHTEGIQRATVTIAGGYNDTLPQDTGRIQIVIVYRFV
jgi:hypothetical protein